MNALRGWIVLLAGTTFLAGTATGVIVARELEPAVPEPGPFAAYRDALVARFDLGDDPVRVRGLAAILRQYDEDIEALEASQLDRIEEDLEKLGVTCRQRIRDYVLPEARRAEFDALCAGLDPLPPDRPQDR